MLGKIKGDKVIWMVVVLLSIFSLLAVYSSTGTLAYRYQSGNTEYYLIKHLVILLFGFGLIYVVHHIKYTYFARISQLAMAIAIPLLLITLVTGTSLNEASRWLTLPVVNITFQSSDLAKLALLMYLARQLAKKQENIKDLKTSFMPILIPVLVICGLILPANFSTSALLFATCVVLMFIGRVNLKYVFTMLGIGVVALSIFIVVLMNSSDQGRIGTWKNRIETFTKGGDSDENYQVEQAKIAIATGGVFGKLPGNSTQRNFLPHPYSDFIYAIIIEEYGLIGGIVIVLLYLILLFRGVVIASRTQGVFGSLLSLGICFSLVFQAMINMGVAVNLMPVTGQPLPLISMGGTSIWFTSIGIGIMLSVSRENEKNKLKENTDQQTNENGDEKYEVRR